MAIAITIAGVTRTSYVASMRLERRLNDIGQGTLVTIDRAGSYRPSVWDEVVVTEGSTTLWRGQIIEVEHGWPVPYRGVRTTCRLVDRAHVTERQMLNTSYPAGTTLITILQDIVALLDDDWPITLHPSQATGPTLTETTLAWTSIRGVLDVLAKTTGWVWGIDLQDRLRMWSPGTLSSGLTFDAATRTVREAGWGQALAREYANALWVSFGPSEVITKTDRFDGDGVTRTWTLRYAINQGDWPHTVYDSAEAAVKPVALYPDANYEWTYELATNQLHQRATDPVLTAGQYVEATYTPGFPQDLLVQNASERTARKIWVRRMTLESVTDRAEAEAIANATLSQGIATPKRLRVRAPALSPDPGTTALVDLPALGLSETMLIESVSTTYDAVYRGAVESELELVSAVSRETWIDYWRERGGGGASTVSGGGGVVTGSSPLPVPLASRESASVVPGTAGAFVPDAIQVTIDAARVASGVVTVRCRVRRVSGSGSVTPQLREVSSGQVIGTGSATTSGTFVTQTFGATLLSGVRTYALALVASDATTEGVAVGTVEV